jgi:PIN domain nuclease of toxin-antitoxin system
MKLLLDTNVFIWWFSEPEKLSPKAAAILADVNNDLLLSAASVWEMQIKLQLGKLKFTVSLREIVESQERANGVQVLPIGLEHVLALDVLPAHHKDPFDRLLAAQANVEGAFLVSSDRVFLSYPVKLLW